MPNRSADALFMLVRSLQKSEKRNFKLYATRNSSNEELKVIQLFDALDKLPEYDEAALLKKAPAITKQQLSNTKALLYKQILASLRLLDNGADIDIQIHEQLDYARILYKKGLYHQSLKLLERIKEMAKAHNQVSLLVQVVSLEKKIESLHITRSMQHRADQLTEEANTINQRLVLMTQLSNLALQLYSWYIKHGHARNSRDEMVLTEYFRRHLPKDAAKATGFYEKLYLYQSYSWYAFIRHDFLMYYRYTQKWVALFEAQPFMIEMDTANYIKGMHNLLSAHFDLGNYPRFREALLRFEAFAGSDTVAQSENNRIQVFIYLNISRINKHFMTGTFREGVALIPAIEEKLAAYNLYMDRHRILVFYYKFASLYFGCAKYNEAIDYLNRIINWKTDLRNDLQCYARLLHLIAHYELGNYGILEHLMKSAYRFMLKMESSSAVEEEIMRFLRRSLKLSRFEEKEAFKKLLEKLQSLQHNKYETRAFLYLDIISWLKSKIRGVAVMDVIRERFLKSTRLERSME